MNKKDEQALHAIQQAMQQDEEACESINRILETHDRTYFTKAVDRVLNQLQITVTDRTSFMNTAYEWFKKRRL